MRLLSIMVVSVAAALSAVATNLPREQGSAAQLCEGGLAQLVGPTSSDGYPAYIACVPVLARPSHGSRLDPSYSRAASRAAAASAYAVCWSEGAWRLIDAAAKRAFGHGTGATGGFVWEGQQVTNLPPRLCRLLDRVVHERRLRIDRWTAWAFKNLTHEALHVAGVDDEAEAECFALQRMAQTMRGLDLDRRDARRLAAVSWRRYQRLRPLQPLYFSPDCREGGPLDLHPRSSRWPTG